MLLEALREVRLWAYPSSCPWGFIALAIVLSCAAGCIFGLCCGVALASRACRQLALQILGVIIESLVPAAPWVQRQTGVLQRRFAEYRA